MGKKPSRSTFIMRVKSFRIVNVSFVPHSGRTRVAIDGLLCGTLRRRGKNSGCQEKLPERCRTKETHRRDGYPSALRDEAAARKDANGYAGATSP